MIIAGRRKYHIILLENIPLLAVRKISFKIPPGVKYCGGLMFSANVAGQASRNYVLGKTALFFNDRKTQPLYYTIHSKPTATLKRKIETLKLDECICEGSFVQGYYADLGIAASYPYRLRIYLDCIENDQQLSNT